MLLPGEQVVHLQQVEPGDAPVTPGLLDLLRPSRCEGWTVADVLLHLAQTNEMAVASVDGRLREFVDEVASQLPQTGSIDDWAGALVDLQRGDAVAARDRWATSAAAQSSVSATPGTLRSSSFRMPSTMRAICSDSDALAPSIRAMMMRTSRSTSG